MHSSSLRCLAVSQPELSPRSAAQLVGAVTSWHPPKQPPGLDCHLGLGTFAVTHLEQVRVGGAGWVVCGGGGRGKASTCMCGWVGVGGRRVGGQVELCAVGGGVSNMHM